jgi:hypothetical protein
VSQPFSRQISKLSALAKATQATSGTKAPYRDAVELAQMIDRAKDHQPLRDDVQ